MVAPLQKFFKSPVAWILIIVIVLMLGWQLFSSFTGFENVPTSQAIKVLEGDEKLREVILIDGEQQIQIVDKDGKRTKSTWVGEQQAADIVKLLNERRENGTLERWNGENPKPGLFSTVLF